MPQQVGAQCWTASGCPPGATDTPRSMVGRSAILELQASILLVLKPSRYPIGVDRRGILAMLGGMPLDRRAHYRACEGGWLRYEVQFAA
jgi:hypothetical protein